MRMREGQKVRRNKNLAPRRERAWFTQRSTLRANVCRLLTELLCKFEGNSIPYVCSYRKKVQIIFFQESTLMYRKGQGKE